MEVVLDNVENFSQFWVYLIQEILVVLITTSLLALFAYIFRKRIKRFLNKKDLLPVNKVPHLKMEFEDASYKEGFRKKLYNLRIENSGEVSLSDIEIFLYNIVTEDDISLIRIEPVKYTINYKDARNNSGEKIIIEFIIDDNKDYEGFYLQFSSEGGILFCTTVYLRKFYSEKFDSFYFEITPQGTSRIKRSLPQRKIVKSSTFIAKKYGINVTVG